MKSILLSIRPEWLAKILNREKTIEVRKNKALANAIRELIKQYGKALIYMYCSKDKKFPLVLSSDGESFQEYCNAKYYPPFIRGDVLNGKVVARFECVNVEEIKYVGYGYHPAETPQNTMAEKSCIYGFDELHKYLQGKNGFAIHISKLEIFDDPKELYEFYRQTKHETEIVNEGGWYIEPLTKAPQNYCYVEENNE